MAEREHQWRHGWIPLTLHAAILKAHGNHERAEQLLAAAKAKRKARKARRGERVFSTPHPAHQEQLERRRRLRSLSEDQIADAMGTADDAELGHLVAELERREKAERKAAADRDRRGRRRDARDADREAEADRLIAAGEDPEEAYRRAYGLSEEQQARQNAIAMLRAEGYRGRNFDELARAAHRDELHREWLAAEAATNGYLLSPAGQRKGIDPESLFEGSEAYARKYASEELRDYWREHGRPSFANTKADLLGGRRRVRTAGDAA